MNEVKKVGVFSFAKFLTLIGALMGLACGIIYSFGGLIIDGFVSLGLLSPETMETPGLSVGTLLAFGAVIGMPLIFAVFGFVTGLIGALLYNLYARMFGGVNVEFE